MSLKIDSVEVQMAEILDSYSKEVRRATNNSQDKVAKECVQKLKNTSPKKTGSYAKGWAVKRSKGKSGIVDVTVHNKTDYQLTHLLENGHIIRNGKGEYGRYNGVKHISPVADWASDAVPQEIERELE